MNGLEIILYIWLALICISFGGLIIFRIIEWIRDRQLMNYEWTPISEPPEDDREVVCWDGNTNDWCTGNFYSAGWYVTEYGLCGTLTNWKDIKPPTK